MASDTDICRLALGHIADAARVNSIEPPDASVQAQHCSRFYPIARDECLDAYPWPFAKRVSTLAQSLLTLPDGEWLFVYTVPDDYIRALKVVPPGAAMDWPGEDFQTRSDEDGLDTIILTNVENAKLHYIYREEQTGRYSPMFVSALSYLLGSYLAGPIVKGRIGVQLKQALYQAFTQTIQMAATRALGAQQNSQNYGGYKPKWISDR